jgi:Cysteine-rich CPXCG
MNNSQLRHHLKGRGSSPLLRLRFKRQNLVSGFQCAGCGEWNDTEVDSSAGRRQQYIEDCQVCCKPNVLSVSWDAETDEYLISAQLE